LPDRFERALVAEQGRYAEAVRRIAELVREEFSHFASPPERGLRDKVAALEAAVDELTDLSARIERLRMIAEATRRYTETTEPDEQDRARLALLLALDELDQHIVAGARREGAVTTKSARPPDGC
jgi:hypothetical protein